MTGESTGAGSAGVHDHIVVGAGSAGCVVARRLVDAGRRVLLVDAGGADRLPEVEDPAAFASLWGSDLYYQYWTEPQPHAAGQRLYWPQGRLVGGGSAVNGMIYCRGHDADYDSWAYAGCAGWDSASVLPYFLRSEDHQDGRSRFHSTGGPLGVSRQPRPSPVSRAFVEAAMQHGLPFVDDYSAGQSLGVSYTQLTVRAGRRSSTWAGFLAPVLDDPRLTVATGAVVSRLLFDGGTCVGVRYAVASHEVDARAEQEVVLCAGVIGSPHILLLSGIGPADELRAVGVPPLLDLPGVGQNLHDHVGCGVVWATTRPVPRAVAQGLEAQVFWTSQPGLPAPDLQHIMVTEVYPVPGYDLPAGTGHGFTCMAGLVRPLSRGRLWLRAADPTVPPALDPCTFAEPYDLDRLADAVEMVRAIGREPALDSWRAAEIAPGSAVDTPGLLRDYVRRSVSSFYHQVGTCRMGVDRQAVVDPALRLHGLAGLRIADASVMPSVPSGNTNAPTIMIGERAADLLLQGHPAHRPSTEAPPCPTARLHP